LASASGAVAATVVDTVPGTSNPFLTGYGAGGSVTINGYTDIVPDESPVFVSNVTGGETVQFGPVTGTVSNGPCCALVGPNGGSPTSSSGGTTVGGYTNFPINALVGVFYDPSAPQGTGASATTSLTPAVNQVFYIGDGSLGTFTVPTGATALYLGTVDGFQWSNNFGSFDVTTSIAPGPTPGEGVLNLALIILMGLAARFRSLIV
jgi:hypothetical protein